MGKLRVYLRRCENEIFSLFSSPFVDYFNVLVTKNTTVFSLVHLVVSRFKTSRYYGDIGNTFFILINNDEVIVNPWQIGVNLLCRTVEVMKMLRVKCRRLR